MVLLGFLFKLLLQILQQIFAGVHLLLVGVLDALVGLQGLGFKQLGFVLQLVDFEYFLINFELFPPIGLLYDVLLNYFLNLLVVLMGRVVPLN